MVYQAASLRELRCLYAAQHSRQLQQLTGCCVRLQTGVGGLEAQLRLRDRLRAS